MKSSKVEVLTYALYQDLFPIEKGTVRDKLLYLIQRVDPQEAICFSSFLNMINQTNSPSGFKGLNESITKTLFYPRESCRIKYPSTIIQHRDNLLSYITAIISNKVDGIKRMTGNGWKADTNRREYGKMLLLINSNLSEFSETSEFEIEKKLIRDYPSKDSSTLFWTYKHRILRYKYIYSVLANNLNTTDKRTWDKLVTDFENEANVSIEDYIRTGTWLFLWYIPNPYAKDSKLDYPHFNPSAPITYYISENAFDKAEFAKNTLALQAKTLNEFQDYFTQPIGSNIDNEIYKYFPYLFNFPIFKNNLNEYALLDLNFYLDGVCGGLMWKLYLSIGDKNLKLFKGVYGKLLEEYFIFLINSLFGKNVKVTYNDEGQPEAIIDVIIDDKRYIVIMEFTTSFYKITSLYNYNNTEFNKDLESIFFDPEKKAGKFKKLNNYIEGINDIDENTTVLPILITENWVGDFDLINRYNGFLDDGIKNNNLQSLSKFKPTILNLDDLETFWASSVAGNEITDFVKKIIDWNSLGEKKGEHLFMFSNFMDGVMNNDKYLAMFDWKLLLDKSHRT